MLTLNLGSEIKNNRLTVIDQQMCPSCKTAMAEVDRLTENGVSFIWYECTRNECDGQWLEKKAGRMGVA